MSQQNQKKNKYDEFIYSLKDPFFDEIFKQLNEKKIRQKPEEENVDLYLLENVLPVLFSGLQELSKEIERFQKDDNILIQETIDLEIRQRFNPLLFLGQYLMRNNPRYEQSNEILKVKQYLRKEKIKRYLMKNYSKYLEVFQKALKKQATNCLYSELHFFTEKIDELYKFEGEFTKFLLAKKEMIKSKEMKQTIKFEDILMSIVDFTKEDCTVATLQEKFEI